MKHCIAAWIAGACLVAQDIPVRSYRGAWFEIQYPASFRVIPSLQSRGMPDEFDSVFFESTDKSVRFYVFSPRWAGETPDIALKDMQETYHLDKRENKDGFRQVWYTIRPKKSGRTRSYLETTNKEGTIRRVVGIEYTDRKAYEKYLPLYNGFMGSLRPR